MKHSVSPSTLHLEPPTWEIMSCRSNPRVDDVSIPCLTTKSFRRVCWRQRCRMDTTACHVVGRKAETTKTRDCFITYVGPCCLKQRHDFAMNCKLLDSAHAAQLLLIQGPGKPSQQACFAPPCRPRPGLLVGFHGLIRLKGWEPTHQLVGQDSQGPPVHRQGVPRRSLRLCVQFG